ncbi:hypothetical protein [Myroides odoratus]|uniref:hypothetical protein n=1 Tax=Myroides odoratus TaxID=256 RepID=UPI0033402DDF
MKSSFISEVERFTAPNDFETNRYIVNNVATYNQDMFIKVLAMGWGIQNSYEITNWLFKISCETPCMQEEAYKIFVNSMFIDNIQFIDIDDKYIDNLIKKINQ